jgi:hypothetical protein
LALVRVLLVVRVGRRSTIRPEKMHIVQEGFDKEDLLRAA